jgi:hypothetical protein
MGESRRLVRMVKRCMKKKDDVVDEGGKKIRNKNDVSYFPIRNR